jgi:hypothetical protein
VTARGLAAGLLGLSLLLGACGSTEDPVSDGPGQPDPSIGTPSSTTAAETTTTAGDDEDAPDIEVGTELPDGWPDDLPIPGDAVLEFSQRTEEDDGTLVLTADFSVDDGGANVYTAFLDDLSDAGATILQRSSGTTDRGYVGSISFETDDYTGNVSVDAAGGTTVLTVSVLPS